MPRSYSHGARPAKPGGALQSAPRRDARSFRLLTAFLLAITPPLLPAGSSGSVARVAGRPPLVLISIVTLRADHLPAYGYTKVATPAIDA